jgi:hypothetical protein
MEEEKRQREEEEKERMENGEEMGNQGDGDMSRAWQNEQSAYMMYQGAFQQSPFA